MKTLIRWNGKFEYSYFLNGREISLFELVKKDANKLGIKIVEMEV
jgi:hypothetical protein